MKWLMLSALRPGASIDMVVDNGFGGEVAVPTNGQAEVMPIRSGLGISRKSRASMGNIWIIYG